MRWITPDGNMIYPDQFIPVFEKNRFCSELDFYMVEQVCRQIREWMDTGKKVIPVAVNQSKLVFYKKDYVNRLIKIIKKYEVPAETDHVGDSGKYPVGRSKRIECENHRTKSKRV